MIQDENRYGAGSMQWAVVQALNHLVMLIDNVSAYGLIVRESKRLGSEDKARTIRVNRP